MKIYNLKNYFLTLFFLIPLTLITGPAIPDLTITFAGIFAIIWMVFKEKKIYLFKNNLLIISIFFWLSLITVSFFSNYFEKSLQDSIIFFRYLLIPIIAYFFYINNKTFYYLSLFIFLIVSFVLLDTLYQFFNYTPNDGFGEDLLGFKSNWYGRLTGPFGDELIPGAYVSRFGLIGFVYLLLNRRLKSFIFLQCLYLSLILVVTYLSGERMAFATYLMALCLLLVFFKDKRNVFLLSIILGLISIYIIYKNHSFYNDFEIIKKTHYHQGLIIEKQFKCLNNQEKICSKLINIQPRFLDIINNFSTSAYGEIYLLAYEMFKDKPITGIGLSAFEKLCQDDKVYNSMMKNYDCASHPHNIYIQWLTETGIIVLILFFIYLIIIVDFIVKNDGDRHFKILSLVLLLILFWPAMSTGSLVKNWYGINVFFIVGICLCLSRVKVRHNMQI